MSMEISNLQVEYCIIITKKKNIKYIGEIVFLKTKSEKKNKKK